MTKYSQDYANNDNEKKNQDNRQNEENVASHTGSIQKL